MSVIRSKEVRYLTVCKCPSFKIRKEGVFLIILNGEQTANMVGKTLADLLQEKTEMMQNVVVELNGKIIHREELADRTLSENDRVELISFVGGG
ncbi:sulfur carrier protein ThiS [Weissella paramesenteroides]|nr:sulfur carrier protein ThiS [Weissella paramesenteroides]QPI47114.1 sulfur carrier protein ThiS [Weissella paramesenteroides]